MERPPKHKRSSGKRRDLDYSDGFNDDNYYSSINNDPNHDFAKNPTPTRLQLAGYKTQAYDNPSFAGPALDAAPGFYYRMAHNQNSSDSSNGAKNRYAVSDSDEGSKNSRWREAHRCKVITAIVVLVVIIVAAVSVAVYFSARAMSDNANGEVKGTDVTTSVMPIPAPIQQGPDFEGEIRVTSQVFTEELTNPNSTTYQTTKAEMEANIDLSFQNSEIADVYNYSEVTGFGNGSLMVDFQVYLIVIMVVGPPPVDTDQTPPPGQTDPPTPAMDIMALLERVKKNTTVVVTAFMRGFNVLKSTNKTNIVLDEQQVQVRVATTTTSTTTTTTTARPTPAPTTSTESPTTTTATQQPATTTTVQQVATETTTVQQPTPTQQPTTTQEQATPEQTTKAQQTPAVTTEQPTTPTSQQAASTTTQQAASTTSRQQSVTTVRGASTTQQAASTTTQQAASTTPRQQPVTTVRDSTTPTTQQAASTTTQQVASTTPRVQPVTTVRESTTSTTQQAALTTPRVQPVTTVRELSTPTTQQAASTTTQQAASTTPRVQPVTTVRESSTPTTQQAASTTPRVQPVTTAREASMSTTQQAASTTPQQPTPATTQTMTTKTTHPPTIRTTQSVVDDTEAPAFTASMTLVDSVWEPELADTNSTQFQQLKQSVESEVDMFYRQSDIAPIYSRSVVVGARPGSVILETIIYLKSRSTLTNADQVSAHVQMAGDDGSAMKQYFREGQRRFEQDGNVTALVFSNIVMAREPAECPVWSEVEAVISTSCATSLFDFKSTRITEEACFHYANTIKCGVYILRTQNKRCSVDELLQMAQAGMTLFNPDQQAAGIDVRSQCAGTNVSISVNLDKTSLCFVPDALLYITQYAISFNISERPPFAPNPCTPAIQGAVHVNSVLKSLGLKCDFQNLTTALSKLDYSKMPDLQQAVTRCTEYSTNLSDDRCFNLTNGSPQQSCLVHIGTFFSPVNVTAEVACSDARKSYECLNKFSGCSLQQSQRSFMDFLSLALTYKKLGNVSIAAGINYNNVYPALVCGSDGASGGTCPDWSEVQQVMSNCDSSIKMLMSADRASEACHHFASTIKCMAFILRTQNMSCSVDELLRMTQTNAGPFSAIKQASSIDVTTQCSGTNFQFSVNLDRTPLCSNPDALSYIAHYVEMDGYDDIDLGYLPNPCTPAFLKAAQVNGVLKSMGLKCDFQSLTTNLSRLDYSRMPEFQEAVARCTEYTTNLEKGDRCYNLTEGSPQQQCLLLFGTFYNVVNVSREQACRDAKAAYECLSQFSGCSVADSRQSFLHSLSFFVTARFLGNWTMMPTANLNNMYSALNCVQGCPSNFSDVWSIVQGPCSKSLEAIAPAGNINDTCSRYVDTLTCAVYILRANKYQCTMQQLRQMSGEEKSPFYQLNVHDNFSLCAASGVELKFSVDLDSTPLCKVPDAIMYVVQYWCDHVDEENNGTERRLTTVRPESVSDASWNMTHADDRNPMMGVPPNPCTNALKKTRCYTSQLKSVGVDCPVEETGPTLASSQILRESDSKFAAEFRQCTDYVVKSSTPGGSRCANLTNPAQAECASWYLSPFHSGKSLTQDEVCYIFTEGIKCLDEKNDCSLDDTQDTLRSYYSLLLTYKHEINVDLREDVNYDNMAKIFSCKPVEPIQACPSIWSDVLNVVQSPCAMSALDAQNSYNLAETCLHYASTMKCGAYIMRANNYNCSVEQVQRLAVSDQQIFSQLAFDVHRNFNQCSTTGADVSFSVDLNTTPLCKVPDALIYVAEYMCREEEKDATPQPEPESGSPKPVSTSPRPGSNSSSMDRMDGVPPNNCTFVLRKTRCITEQLDSAGLMCSVDEVGPALFESALLRRSNTSFARNILQCSDYLAGGQDPSRSDPCLNTTFDAAQRPCFLHLLTFFTPEYTSASGACSAVSSAVDCLTKVSRCSSEATQRSVISYLSLLYSYKHIIDRPLDPNVNYETVRNAFQCDRTDCPTWEEVTGVMSESCDASLMALRSARTSQEACSHYASTIKCGVYILRTRNRRCSVDELLQMAGTDTELFNPTRQAAGIDVRSQCSRTNFQFSDDLDSTSLCLNPDALMYIAHYEVLPGMDAMRPDMNMTTVPPRNPNSMTPPSMTSWTTSRPDEKMDDELGFPSNPCTMALLAASQVNGVLKSLGLKCDFLSLTNTLGVLDYSAGPEFKQAVDKCNVYSQRFENNEDRCYNVSIGSPHITNCSIYLAPFHTPANVSSEQACRSVDEAVACLSRASGCSEEASRQSLMDFLSLTFTYYKLADIKLTPDVNLNNTYRALVCDREEDSADPMFMAQVTISSMQWMETMAYPASDQFRQTAARIQQMVDSLFKMSNMSSVYSHSKVTKLSAGSVVAVVEVYMVDVEKVTDPQARYMYSLLRGAGSLRRMYEFFNEGMKRASETGQMNMTISGYNFTQPGMEYPTYTTAAPMYNTTARPDDLEPELRFVANVTTRRMSWTPDLGDRYSNSSRETARKFEAVINAAFRSSDIGPIFAGSRIRFLWEGSVRGFAEIYLLANSYRSEQQEWYQQLNNNESLTFIRKYFYQGLGNVMDQEITIDDISFDMPPGKFPIPSCPEWNMLWRLAHEGCSPSLRAAEAAPTLESACNHYISSLKCASFIARTQFYDCSVEHLKREAVKDSWVFTNQIMQYNLSEQCADRKIDMIAELDEAPLCESPDAYLYIAEYICQDWNYDGSTRPPNYPDEMTRPSGPMQYETTTPRRSYPQETSNQNDPTTPYYSGGYKTTGKPSYQGSENYTTSGPGWYSTTTPGMPHYAQTPCHEYIERGKCIQQTLKSLEVSCPRVKVFEVLNRYNGTILTEPASRCGEYYGSVVSNECFDPEANSKCSSDLYAVYGLAEVKDACGYWYSGPVECLYKNTARNCSRAAVDRAWRGYLKLLLTLREISSSMQLMNMPVMERIFQCPAERPGECLPSDDLGITVHECDADFDCEHPKKCCPVGGGAGQVCQNPVYTNHFGVTVVIDADFRDSDYDLRSQRMMQIRDGLRRLFRQLPGFLGLEIESSKPGSIEVETQVTVRNGTKAEDVRRVMNMTQGAPIFFEGRNHSILYTVYNTGGMCRYMYCGEGLCMNNMTASVCVCPKGRTGERCEQYGNGTIPRPPSQELMNCTDWRDIWSRVSGPCMASLDSARYSHFDQCSHYAAFIKCAAFVMRAQHHRCSEDTIRRMALSNYWHFTSASSPLDSPGYPTNQPGYESSSDYYSSRSHDRTSGMHLYSTSPPDGLTADFGPPSDLYGSSDYYGSTSDLYRSPSDHYSSTDRYRSDSYSSEWDHSSSAYGGAPYEKSLPYVCMGHRVPSRVDVERTEPCANPDALEYILKYHCGEDVYPGLATPGYDHSSSHYSGGYPSSGYPYNSDPWYPSHSGSHDNSGSWYPSQSGSHYDSDSWYTSQSGSHYNSDSWYTSESGSHYNSDSWNPSQSGSHYNSNSWNPSQSGSQYNSNSWNPSQSGSHYNSDSWNPSQSGSHYNSDSWNPSQSGSHYYSDTWNPSQSGSHYNSDSRNPSQSGSQYYSDTWNPSQSNEGWYSSSNYYHTASNPPYPYYTSSPPPHTRTDKFWTPCSAMARRYECVQRRLQVTGVMCPTTQIMQTQQNASLSMPMSEALPCAEYGAKVVTDRCLNLGSATTDCITDLFFLYTTSKAYDACGSFKRGMECISKMSQGCSKGQVDTAWREYLSYMLTMQGALGNVPLNYDAIEQVLSCSAVTERPGECPPSGEDGITIHECDDNQGCSYPKKCCTVGGGAGQVCRDPIFTNSFGLSVTIGADFKDTDYDLKSRRIMEIQQQLRMILERFPEFVRLDIDRTTPGSIHLEGTVTVDRSAGFESLRNIVGKLNGAPVVFDGLNGTVTNATVVNSGYCMWKPCADGMCVNNRTSGTCVCPRGRGGEYCERYDGKGGCPTYGEITRLSGQTCYPIFASLVNRNATLFSNSSLYNYTFADTNHMPENRQQHCRLYGDLLRCLALSLREDYECDTKDLHELSQTNSQSMFNMFAFYPADCDDSAPGKLDVSDGVCKSLDLYELLMEYNCPRNLNASHFSRFNNSACLQFYDTVSCLSRETVTILQDRTCSEANVMSVLKGPMRSDMSNYSVCFDAGMLVGQEGEVLVRNASGLVSVCASGWDTNDANVVCRQLGFEAGRAFNRSGSSSKYMGRRQTRPPGASNFRCVGSERALNQCRYDSFATCGEYDDHAAVTCYNGELKYELVPAKPGVSYGYINMTRQGPTGLVCSSYTGWDEAASLCRAAGFVNGGTLYPLPLDPPAPMNVWRNYLQCDGPGRDVEACAYFQWQFGPSVWPNNSDGMRVGQVCDGKHGNLVKVFCFDKQVKLHTGLFNSSGIAQVFRRGDKSPAPEAYPFCRIGFDNFIADLFCQEIGFPQGGISLNFNPYDNGYLQNSYQVNCSGQETAFSECKVYEGPSYCQAPAVVHCNHDVEQGVAELDVRLHNPYGGPYDIQLVLTYYDGEWGTICSDSWTDSEANTICRSRGFNGGFAWTKDRSRYRPHLIHNVTCREEDSSLKNCNYTPLQSDICAYRKDAAARCYNTDDLAKYTLEGNSDNYGLVHVTYNNTEGLLCAEDMNEVHYDVLCRSLGMYGGERYPEELPLPDKGTVWGTKFAYNCDKDSASLEACRQGEWYPVRNYKAENYTQDMLPPCYGGYAKAFCFNSAVRLSMGFKNRTGVLQMNYDGKYKDVSADGLTDEALNTLCEQATGSVMVQALPLSPNLFVGHQASSPVTLNSTCMEAGQLVEMCVDTSENYSRTSNQLSAVHCYEGGLPKGNLEEWMLDLGGRVMVKRYGTWGMACWDDFNDTVAELFCKSQGYIGGFRSRDTAPPSGRFPYWVHKVSCPENAASFYDCDVSLSTNNTQCYTQAAASVKCYSQDQYVKLFLADTVSTTSGTITGRVVARKDNRTGYLCRAWNYDDAFAGALCRMMNYTKGGFLAVDTYRLPEPQFNEAWSPYLQCSTDSPSLNVMQCLQGWSYEQLYYLSNDDFPRRAASKCSEHLAEVTCYADTPGPDHNTTGPSELWPCPDWNSVWRQVSGPCMAALDTAKYSYTDQCSHYAAFLKCASFVMKVNNYRCHEDDIERMALNNYWLFYTSGSNGNGGSSYYGSSSYYYPSHSDSYSNHYGSSSGMHGSSSWYPSYSDSKYHGSSSDYYGHSSSAYGSSGYYPSYSDSKYHGSSSDYYGHSSSVYGSSGSYDPYSDSKYHGSSSDYYGHSSSAYGSSGYYPSYSDSKYHGSSSDYYGHSSSVYGSSGSYDPYSDSKYHGSSSNYYGHSSSVYGSSGSYDPYSDSKYHRSSSDYYGHSSSSYLDPSYSAGSRRDEPSGYYASSTDYHPPHDYSSSYGGGGDSWYYTSLPVMCRYHRAPSMVDLLSTNPCENPDAYAYIMKYRCGYDMYHGPSMPDYGGSSSHYSSGSHWYPSSGSHYNSDSWYQSQSGSHYNSDSWNPSQSGSHYNSDSWNPSQSVSHYNSDSWNPSQSGSHYNSDSWNPSQSVSHYNSDSWNPSRSGSHYNSDSWNPSQSGSHYNSDSWNPSQSGSHYNSDSWNPSQSGSHYNSNSWNPSQSGSHYNSDSWNPSQSGSHYNSNSWNPSQSGSHYNSDSWNPSQSGSHYNSDSWNPSQSVSHYNSDSWNPSQSGSHYNSDSWKPSQSVSHYNSDSWNPSQSGSHYNSDSWKPSQSGSHYNSNSWNPSQSGSHYNIDTWNPSQSGSHYNSDSWNPSQSGSHYNSDSWNPSQSGSHYNSGSWYTTPTQSSYYGSSSGYYYPPYNNPSTPPQNACMRLTQKAECIARSLGDLGLTCSASTVASTIQRHRFESLSGDVDMCDDFLGEIMQDSCLKAQLTGSQPNLCLKHFDRVSSSDDACGLLNAAVSCSVQKYPQECSRENATRVLRQWLLVEQVVPGWSEIDLGIMVNQETKQNFFRCPYYQRKEGCPTFGELTEKTYRAGEKVVESYNISAEMNSSALCRIYEDLVAAAMLTTADYPQCTAQDLHQLAVNNQEYLRNLTGFTFGECADKVKLPMVDKNQDMCDNPYLIKFLAGGRYVCKDYNLTQPITSPGGSCQRAFSAVLCFWRYSDRFLPEGMKCGRDDIIRGLRANRQYLHQSYDRCLDSDVALAYGNVVVANIEGQWRTLCGNWWSDREAKIVCHSLGYKFGIAFNSSMSSMIEEAFGNLRRDSETRSVRCSGNETSLKDCRFEKLEYCWGGGQAGATCFNTELKYELIPAKPGATYGFIKRTADNRTATVSLQWYGERETNLLCQAAGFPYGGIPFPNPLQEEEKDDFYWNAYSSCNGDSATSIEQCVGGSWNYQSAYMDVESANGTVTKTVNPYHRLAQVFCFSGPLRLHNSLLNSTGVAQIRNEEDDSKYDRRQYLGICKEGFDNFEASLFCRGLGLGFEGGIALNYLPFRYSFESSNFFNVSCKGGEREFQDCDVERVTMGSCYRPAVVSCTPRLENDKAQELTVKLFSDNRTIMVYHQDQWGYICGDRWTDVEAETVCRGLNYSSGIAASRSSDSGGYPYLLHNVTCDNNAASLADCLSDDVKSDVCGYEDPAGVFCYNAGDLPSYSLYNGRDASPRYGWAYMTREQTKGRLCSYFNPDTHYRVLCRQLGFIDGEQYRADLPEQEDLPFWGTSFSGCDKDSTSLASCQTAPWEKMQISQGSGSSDGNYTEIVRPYCPYDSIKAFCYNDTVRTHMGFYNTSGVVEVAADNDYYQVCIPYPSYTQEVADVACHQLTSSPTSSAIRIEAEIFSYLTKSVVTVNGTSCHGTEEMLEQCTSKMLISKNSDCYGDRKRLAVVCYDGERPSDNLEMWRIDSESNVMVRRLGMWGHVCSQTWTNKEASAVCKTLGRYDGVVGIGNSWGTRLPTWVERMECPVGADSIQECNITKVDYNVQRQSHYFSCDGRRAACFDQDDVARLFFVDYNSITQPQGPGGRVSRGRVAVEYQGTTGYFCGYSLTQSEENFSTVCRLMGFPRGGQRLNASLPAPSTYNQGWLVEQRCGRWDRTVHYMSCISNWRQEGIRYPGSSELTPCWQNIPAVSCFEDNYRLESSSRSRNQGLLLVWIQDKQQWDQVCRTNFTEMEANAACRQLGLSDSGHVLPAGTLPPNAYYSTAGIRYQCSRSNTDTLDECTIVQDTYCMEDVPLWLSCDVPT